MNRSLKIRKFEPKQDFSVMLENLIYNRRYDAIVKKCEPDYRNYMCEFLIGSTEVVIRMGISRKLNGENVYTMFVRYDDFKSFEGNISENDYDRIWHVLPSHTSVTYDEEFDEIFSRYATISEFTSK